MQHDAVRKTMQKIGSLFLLFAVVTFSVLTSSVRAENAAFSALIPALAPPPSNQALAEIPDPGRKLLALRSYIRMGTRLASRWSWTDAEIAAFQGSPEQLALQAEIDAVSAHFADANPGYEIYVHATVRSLDTQIKRWNANDSVGTAAAELLAAFEDRFGSEDGQPGAIDPAALKTWLTRFKLSRRPNLAAPGLTLHGRASAIDFQIMKDGRIVAGANSKQIDTVWRAEKWDEKLKASMDAAGPSFTGPLTSPDEPWHYNYKPKPVAKEDAVASTLPEAVRTPADPPPVASPPVPLPIPAQVPLPLPRPRYP